jgi:mannonate dehydratase
MANRFSRRTLMRGAGGAALAQSLAKMEAAPAARQWPIEEGADTPKICLGAGDGGGPLPTPVPRTEGRPGGYGGYLPPNTKPASAPDAAGRNLPASYRRLLQLGVKHAIGVPIEGMPWTAESVRAAVQTAREAGIVAYNSMINLPASIIYGKPERSKDMEMVLASIEAAAKGGLPVIEYNFYAHRGIEGYYETVGRAGAGYTGFDYDVELLVDEKGNVVQPVYRDEQGRITAESLAAFPNAKKVKFRDLPALADEGAHNLEEMWANATWFLKAAVPAAEKAGVKLALHPNDPPAPVSRKSQQIMGTVAGWKRLVSIVDSPANGITFDCGVTREMGEDPVATAEYFASKKRMNHMHYRNVVVERPYEKYQELFIDAGLVDMFGVMKAIVRNKYTGTIYPEHPRALDHDRDRVGPGGRLPGYPGGGGYTGFAYSVAYTRAMMQAAAETI